MELYSTFIIDYAKFLVGLTCSVLFLVWGMAGKAGGGGGGVKLRFLELIDSISIDCCAAFPYLWICIVSLKVLHQFPPPN